LRALGLALVESARELNAQAKAAGHLADPGSVEVKGSKP
jgi:hypothetical protein